VKPLAGQARSQVVVIGAGPAGLTAAYELGKHGVPVTVLEKDERFVGGLARTAEYRGYRFDIGGHRFFSKNQEIEDLWTEILGSEMLDRRRLSRIYYRGRYFHYPLKVGNALRNLGPVETVRCVASYAWAQVRPARSPRSFDAWVSNQFGRRLFEIFFKTYTEKVWGIPTSELSADWAAQRIKGLDMAALVRSTLRRRPGASRDGDRSQVIKTLIDQFRYPRLGPGQMWERVSSLLPSRGGQVLLGRAVVTVQHSGGRVRSVRTEGGEEFEGTDFVSSLPIRELVAGLDPPAPPEVRHAASSLSYRDFLTVALIVDRPRVFPDNWIYVHEPGVQVGRIQNFGAWSEDMLADPGRCCLGLEYFCFEGDGLWGATDDQLVARARRELAQLGMAREEEVLDGTVVRMAKAYPVYDDAYRDHLEVIRGWLESALPNLHLCGRNGLHRYNNQDHSMMTALVVARNIAEGLGLDPWKVNGDAEYIEEVRPGDTDATGRQAPLRVAG
jgi:protoporphyrinogen oxidase